MNTFLLTAAMCAILLIEPASAMKCTGTATYKLTFNYMWKSPNFKNVPSSAHFSPLSAHSHTTRFSAFSAYGYATPGVKLVAETGRTSTIRREFENAKQRGFIHDYAIDNVVPDGAGSASVTVKASCSHSYVSALTMVAPSPDWILAIFRLPVVRKGKFIESAKGKLRVWDAGTDSGKTLFAGDVETKPRENIAPLLMPPFGNKPLATYTLVKM